MATDEEKTTVVIEGKDELSGSAKSAAEALRDLKSEIDQGRRSLSEMQKAMRELKGQTGTEAVRAQQALTKAITEQRDKIAANQAAYANLGGAYSKVPSKSFRSQLMALTEATKNAPGPLSRMGGALGFVTKHLLTTRAAMFAGVAAIVALTAATGVAIKRLTSYAITSQNARRSELLRLEGMTKLRTALTMTYGLGAMKADKLQTAIDNVSASVAISRDQVGRYANQLYMSGVRGDNLTKSLKAVSQTASAQGEGAASMAAGWAAGLALTGQSVDRFAKRVEQRLGGTVQKQMRDLDVIAMKQQESFGLLFTKVDVEPFLKAKKAFADLFSQTTNSGRYLRDLLGTVLQPFVNGATYAQTALKIAFQEIIIFSLRVQIAFLKLAVGAVSSLLAIRAGFQIVTKYFRTWRDDVKETTGFAVDKIKEVHAALGDLATAVEVVGAAYMGRYLTGLVASNKELLIQGARAAYAGGQYLFQLAPKIWAAVAAQWANIVAMKAGAKTSLTTLIPALAQGALGFLRLAMTSAAAALGVLALPAALVLIAYGMIQWYRVIKTLWNEVGSELVAGLIRGIKNKWAEAKSTIKDLGVAIKQWFTGILDIHSPSKVFAKYGEALSDGLRIGIEAKTPETQAAVEAMAKVPSTPPVTPGAGVRNDAPSNSVNIEQLHIHSKATDAAGIATDIKRELESILTGLAITVGATP